MTPQTVCQEANERFLWLRARAVHVIPAGCPTRNNNNKKNQQTHCFTAGAGGQKKQPHQNPKQKLQDHHSGQDEDSSGTGIGKGQGPKGVRQQQYKPIPHYKDHSHNLNQSTDWGREGGGVKSEIFFF